MEAFLVSTGLVALAEIGDKTQLLALVLAARFRAPVPIVLGILAATIANHLIAAALGAGAGDVLSGPALRWILALSFLAMGVWMLVPDSLGGEPKFVERWGAFGATLVSFFLIEIGDKTQLATVALAAKYQLVLLVAAGTTLGMLIADVPVVFIGRMAGKKIPLRAIRFAAAGLFIALGLAALAGIGDLVP